MIQKFCSQVVPKFVETLCPYKNLHVNVHSNVCIIFKYDSKYALCIW